MGTSPRTSISSPVIPFSSTANSLQKGEKRSPTYSAFACGVKNENDHCPNSSPFHSATISPGSKLQPHQKHIKSEPTESFTHLPSVGKPLASNRKPSIHTNENDNET